MSQFARNDRPSPFWMPFTAEERFRDAPRMLVEAKGMHYTSDDGHRILDGTGGYGAVTRATATPRSPRRSRRSSRSWITRRLSTWAIRSPSTSPAGS